MNLFEFATLKKKRYPQLPVNVWIQQEPKDKKLQHNLPRIKFQNNYSDDFTSNSDLISLSISDNPTVLQKKKISISSSDFEALRKFVILNKDVLLKFWNQELMDEDELKPLLNFKI